MHTYPLNKNDLNDISIGSELRHTITNTSQFQDALDKTYEDTEFTKDRI